MSLKLFCFSIISLPADLAQHPVYDLLWKHGVMYLASEQGYYLIDANGQVQPADVPMERGVPVYQLHNDSQDGDWVSSYDKLFYRHRQQQWQVISRDELGSATQFNDIYEDRQQNVWLGSFGDGLYRVSRGKIKRVIGQGQQDVMVRSVVRTADDTLLVASSQRLGLLDKNAQYREIQLSGDTPLNVVQDIETDGNNWLLATDNGPKRLSLTDGKLVPMVEQLRGVKTKTIKKRHAGGYWLGTNNGLFHYEKNLVPFAFNHEFESSVITFVQDNPDKLLLGTTRGAYQYQQDKLLRIGLSTPLYNAFVTTMLQVPQGPLVVGTVDDGLFIRMFDGKWLQFDTSTGLPFEPVVSLYHDAPTDYVWVSTLKGIFRFQANQLSEMRSGRNVFEEVLTPYERQLGTAPGRCCNGSGASKVVFWQNQLWYPTLKGLVAVPVNLKASSSQNYQPIVQQVQAHKSYSLLPDQNRLVLETDERNLSVRYTAIDFLKPVALEFRYQLVGFDQDWHQVGGRREAIYTNLPAGRYQFRLQARNLNQSWDLAGQTTLELVIPRRFDETMMYRGLWLLLGVFTLYGLFWLARRNVQLREAELTKLVKLRTSELESSNMRLNELNEQLSQLTHKDALTGLRNRRFLFEQLPKDIEHYQRNRESMLAQNKCIALMQLDLDNFKVINDKFGNSAGDSILQQVSGLLIRETRGSDYVVRYAGEQFMLVLRDIPLDMVRDFACRLNELIGVEAFVLPDGREVSVQCSVGYAIYPLELLGGQLIGWEISLQLAELALYHVKHNGRNGAATIQFDRQVDAFEFEDSDHIEAQIEKLLADGVAWFELHSGRQTENILN